MYFMTHSLPFNPIVSSHLWPTTPTLHLLMTHRARKICIMIVRVAADDRGKGYHITFSKEMAKMTTTAFHEASNSLHFKVRLQIYALNAQMYPRRKALVSNALVLRQLRRRS